MKTYLSAIFGLLIFATACSNNTNKQLQEEVIAVHDEVMPMMGTFVHNSMAIDSILNNFAEIKTQHAEIDTLQEKEKLTALKGKIENANDAMNEWMHNLNLDFEKLSEAEVTTYLEGEKAKMDAINKQFKEVEAESKKALGLYSK